MTKQTQRSYLLRLWRDHAHAPMHATLIPVECQDNPRHFAKLEELFAFLIAEADPATRADDRSQWDTDHCTPEDLC